MQLIVDLGPQPPSNRFLRSADEATPLHPLRVMQCEGCGLVQLADPMPVDMVRSRFEWLTYNEPEGHLDRLVDRLADWMTGQAGERPSDLPDVLGVTYKDDSTLARLARRGLGHTRRLDPATDLEVHDPLASLETFQRALTPARARALAERQGAADVVVARHILEHAHDPAAFLEACCELARPGGLIVFEVPDSSTFLEACDYSFLWEEHVCYFTPATLQYFLAARGLHVGETLVFPYSLENSINAILVNSRGMAVDHAADPAEIARGRRFAQGFDRRRAGYRRRIEALKASVGRVAVFGAGHLATKFINFNGVADLLEGVVDDSPNKRHLFMPGSRLPIVGSSLLADPSLGVCLMSLSPESEQKVVAAQKPFVARGGQLLSMFACSPRSLECDARRAGEAG
jgi:hypothetical protein